MSKHATSRCRTDRCGGMRMTTLAGLGVVSGVLCALAHIGFGADTFKLDGLRVTAAGAVGPSSMRFDLVVIGDGYIAKDYGPGGRWEQDSARLVNNFFEKKPFKTLRSLFNVFVVEAISLDRGADDSPGRDTRRTIFNTCYGRDGIDRLMAIQDTKAFGRAMKNVPEVDAALLLVNDMRFGGCGTSAEGLPVGVCSNDSRAFITLIHELGHSLGNLGDEYVDAQVAATHDIPPSGDLPYPNLTLARCIDMRSADALVDSLKWGHFLTEPNAKKFYGKGLYEGGFYRTTGVFRPAAICAMGHDTGGNFCYACEAEMTAAIYRTCGRGPGGGVFPKSVPRMKIPMRRVHFLYSLGLFGKASQEIARVEKLKPLPAKCTEQIAALREGIGASLKEGLAKVDVAVQGGDSLGAHELLDLLAISFKDADGYAAVEAKKNEVTGPASFARALKADREFLKLQILLKDPRVTAGRTEAVRKLVEAFIKKNDGTKAADKAKRLIAEGS
jgi:hypothetical protein